VSDYTPTTEDIRTAYTKYTQPSLSNSGELFYGDKAEFDRWLKSTLQKAQFAERERIIKLLEENHSWAWQHDPVSQDSCASCESIALIKGENK
jgi:hypothetical protein